MARAKLRNDIPGYKRTNAEAMRSFNEAVMAVARAAVQSTLKDVAREMVVSAVDNAEFSDYSGAMIRSYVAAQISRKKWVDYKGNIARFLNGAQTRRGGGLTATKYYALYNDIMRHAGKMVVARSSDIPGITPLDKGRKVGRGDKKRWLKTIRVVRSHEKPKTILSTHEPKNYATLVDRNISNTDMMPEGIFKNMNGAVQDGVILTNMAPYAREVHRQWNRVLPGNFSKDMKSFFIHRLEWKLRK